MIKGLKGLLVYYESKILNMFLKDCVLLQAFIVTMTPYLQQKITAR